MHPFGGAQKCPTCDENVYAAEQVMGPGRRVYHKPCLRCMTCSRRLDSLSLLEHNQEPYCKSCHVKNFGTRDLRSANLTPSSPPVTPTRRTRSPPPITPSDSLASSSSTPEPPSDEEEADPGQATTMSSVTNDSLPPTSFPASSTFPRAATSSLPAPRRNSMETGATTVSRATARPLSPSMTGSSTASAPTYLRTNTTGTRFEASLKQSYTGNTGAKKTFGPSPGFEGTPLCPRCGKAVYFAEQVKASGRTWHKPCLRCTECSSLLDSTRLTEKDGQVICRSCYSKLHGPQGSGYALLGRAG